MKRLSLFSILSAVLLSSCEQKSFTNEFSGTIWEGVEISKELWDEQLGLPPDTIYHRLEFKEWSDHLVSHHKQYELNGEWYYEGLFEYMTLFGGIRMDWEILWTKDTIPKVLHLSEDRTLMYEYGDDGFVELKRIR